MKKFGLVLLTAIGLSLANGAVAAPPPAGESDAAITVTGIRPGPEKVDLPASIADGRIDARRYLKPAEARHVLKVALDRPRARLIADDDLASGREIGRPCEVVRRVRISTPGADSVFIVSKSEPLWPFRSETASVAVASLPRALSALQGEGAVIVAQPFTAGNQEVAVVQTTAGKVFELHAPRRPALSKTKQRFGVTRPYEPINTDRPALTARSTVGAAGDACRMADVAKAGKRAS